MITTVCIMSEEEFNRFLKKELLKLDIFIFTSLFLFLLFCLSIVLT